MANCDPAGMKSATPKEIRLMLRERERERERERGGNMWANRGKKRSNFPAIKTVTSPNEGGAAVLVCHFLTKSATTEQATAAVLILIPTQIQITF